jgi:hypothetical protein
MQNTMKQQIDIVIKGTEKIEQKEKMKKIMERKEQESKQLEEQEKMEKDKITKEKEQQEKIIVLQKELEKLTPVELQEFYEDKLKKREEDIKYELSSVEHTIDVINSQKEMLKKESYAPDRKRSKNHEFDEIKKEHDAMLSIHLLEYIQVSSKEELHKKIEKSKNVDDIRYFLSKNRK